MSHSLHMLPLILTFILQNTVLNAYLPSLGWFSITNTSLCVGEGVHSDSWFTLFPLVLVWAKNLRIESVPELLWGVAAVALECCSKLVSLGILIFVWSHMDLCDHGLLWVRYKGYCVEPTEWYVVCRNPFSWAIILEISALVEQGICAPVGFQVGRLLETVPPRKKDFKKNKIYKKFLAEVWLLNQIS